MEDNISDSLWLLRIPGHANGTYQCPATFQHFMNDIFQDMSDVFVVVYLDDILVYSESEALHRNHI